MAGFGGQPCCVIVHGSESTYLYDNRRTEELKN
jgi:hypothetical protein